MGRRLYKSSHALNWMSNGRELGWISHMRRSSWNIGSLSKSTSPCNWHYLTCKLQKIKAESVKMRKCNPSLFVTMEVYINAIRLRAK
ncbi:hypothetical protein CICLE_v10026861mg [Citrus x clementina]|uniref:Uncharacterized protein n=1 Tax=Citrus clementina TaxID=85681 RepID=V4SJU2_CITCL|nr:hypothetical protein CICLE_v10026861mg [Citrus x clementina]